MDTIELTRIYEKAREASERLKDAEANSGALSAQALFEIASPYMTPETRRQFEIIARLGKIRAMLESYASAAFNSRQDGGQWEIEALNAMLPYADEKTARRIDVLLNFYGLKNSLEAIV